MTLQDTSSTPAAPPRPAPPPDFVLRMQATFTDIAVIGLVAEGFRIDAYYKGNVVAGPLADGIVRGVDYLLIRPDGVSVLDVRETITTPARHRIAVRARGYGSVRAAPPARRDAIPSLGAEFVWPDTPSPLLGVALCQTADPEFLWMNEALLVFSGTVNLGTSKLEAVARVLTPEIVLGDAAAACVPRPLRIPSDQTG